MSLNTLFDKSEQFSIQFACRTATRKELTATQKESLKNALEEINSDLFERTVENLPSGVLFQTVKEYNVGPLTIAGPTFIMTTNSVSIIKPLKLGALNLINNLTLNEYMQQYMVQINNDMATALNQIAVAVSGLQYKRAGKIFEFALSHITPDEKIGILTNLFNYDLNEIGEVNLSITKFEDLSGVLLNIKTQLGFQQLNLTTPFNLNVRLDINNRNLLNSMEPSDINSVWSKADSIIENQLGSILNISN